MTFGRVAEAFLRLCVAELGAEAQGTGVALVMDRLAGTQVVGWR